MKRSIDRGETLTIHGAVLDSSDRVWYYLTVDDIATDGWMRDYVVDVDGDLAAPTATPDPAATPASDAGNAAESESASPAIGTATTNRAANLRNSMNGEVVTQVKRNTQVQILSVSTDGSGNTWYQVQVEGSGRSGYMRDYVLNLDEELSGSESSSSTQEDLQDREVVGRAFTNRAANVRESPVSGAAVIRQLSAGNQLRILDMYEDRDGKIWYEVVTSSGKTHGFVRDYVITITEIDRDLEAKTYEP